MATEARITMKLFIDTNRNKVLFAEAGKECVDFLLHILSLPLGSIINLTRTPAIGSIGNLYGSFESLGANYLREGLNKDCLLKPKPPAGVPVLRVDPLFATRPITAVSVTYRDGYGLPAPGFQLRTEPVKCLRTAGYVKEAVNYMIRDDLCIEPMSMSALMNRFGVEDVAYCQEEREVSVDMNVGLALLKASIRSQTVLTDVFLTNQALLLLN